jgi:hypothetical protein
MSWIRNTAIMDADEILYKHGIAFLKKFHPVLPEKPHTKILLKGSYQG